MYFMLFNVHQLLKSNTEQTGNRVKSLHFVESKDAKRRQNKPYD